METLNTEKTPATILRAGEVCVPCRLCGTPIVAEEWLAKYGVLCNTCGDKMAKQDQDRIRTEAEAERLNSWLAVCPPAFLDTTREGLPRPELLDRVLKWKYGKRGLILHGLTGLGKSRCAWLLMKREHQAGRKLAVLDHGAAYEYAAMYARNNSTQEASAWVHQMARVSLLFLDDVFKAKLTDSFEQALFTVISTRCENALPTIVTMNDTGNSLKGRMSADRGDALYRRLRESCEQIPFV